MTHSISRPVFSMSDRQRFQRGKRLLITLLLIAGLLPGVASGIIRPSVALAASSVTDCTDGGAPGTLRGVIGAEAANATDIITFNCGAGAHTIDLSTPGGGTNTPLNIAAGLHLTIQGAGNITVSGGTTPGTQLFTVAAGADLTLDDLNLQNGLAGTDGGAIFNSGTLTVTNNSQFDNNTATGNGGAIFNSGSLIVDGSSFGTATANNAVLGGAIYNDINASTTITNSSVIDNGNASGDGGAIFNSGTLLVYGSTLGGNTGNSAGGNGGAIFNNSVQPVMITGSQFVLNYANGTGATDGGGAIYNITGTVSLQQTLLSDNNAVANGGAIENEASGTLSVDQTIFSKNTNNATPGNGGAIDNSGILTVTNGTIFDSNSAGCGCGSNPGNGGAIQNNASAQATITDTTFFGNTANGTVTGNGGAIENEGLLSLTNSFLAINASSTGNGGAIDAAASGTITVTNATFFENDATTGKGGAIANEGNSTVTLLNLTVYGNTANTGQGAGLYTGAGTGSMAIANSIVVSNTNENCVNNGGTFTDAGYNLEFPSNSCAFTDHAQNSDPLLYKPLNNGGPTDTMALLGVAPGLPPSPAIDNGNPATPGGPYPACPLTDQRGAARVGVCDIGAFEYGALYGTIIAHRGNPQSATVAQPFATPLQAIVEDYQFPPVEGVVVTFTAPPMGASGTFPGNTTVVTATTDANGIATPPPFTANKIAGTYQIVASNPDYGTANFALTNLPDLGSGFHLYATAGNPQSTPVNTNLLTPLQATIDDQFGNPLAGQTVTWNVVPGASGASTTATGPFTAMTGSMGGATLATTLTANNIGGAYTAKASITISGTTKTVSYSLYNTVSGPYFIHPFLNPPPATATVNTNYGDLSVVVSDTNGNPATGSVKFIAPPAGNIAASGVFSGNTTVTLVNGKATAPVFKANHVTGSYNVVAVYADTNGNIYTYSFGLTNTPGPVTSLTPSAGNPQLAFVNTPFGTNLQAVARDQYGDPISGLNVTFTPPASGAGGTFSSGNPASITTDAAGFATAPVFTANGTTGSYNVVAKTGALTTNFFLTNLYNGVTTLVASAGTPQNAQVGNAFATKLQAIARDAQGNLLAGATVIFTAPNASGNGPGGTFAGGSTTFSAPTDASGVVTATIFTANNISGNYDVIATSGVATAIFQLANTPVPPTLTTVTSSSNPSAMSANVTFTVTVTSSAGIPTGSVTLMDGANTLATTPLSTGNAIFNKVFTTAGAHNIIAVYTSNNVAFPGSNSTILVQTVNSGVYYAPYIANGAEGYLTSLELFNPTNAGGTLQVSYFDRSGAQMGGTQTQAINAVSHLLISQNTIRNPGMFKPNVGSAIVTSTVALTGSGLEDSIFPSTPPVNPNYHGAMEYALANAGLSLELPTIYKNAYGGYSTGIDIQNPNSVPATIVVSYFYGFYPANKPNGGVVETQNITIPAYGAIGLYTGPNGDNVLPDGFAGSGRIISSNVPVAAIVNEFNISGAGTLYNSGMSYEAHPTGPAGQPMLTYLPFARNKTGATSATDLTGFNVRNAMAGNNNLFVTTYDYNGNIIEQLNPTNTPQLSLPANGYYANATLITHKNINFIGSVVISSTGPIAVAMNHVDYTTNGDDNYTGDSTPALHLAGGRVTCSYNGYNTTLYLQNTTGSTAHVVLTYVADGNLGQTYTQVINIAPHGGSKIDQMAAGILPLGFYGSVSITSDQPLAGTAQELKAGESGTIRAANLVDLP